MSSNTGRSLIAPRTSAGGSNLQQDLSRFRCASGIASPAPSSTGLYTPISNLFHSNSFILQRSTTAPLVSCPSEVDDQRYQETLYATPPVTTGEDVRERESSLFMRLVIRRLRMFTTNTAAVHHVLSTMSVRLPCRTLIHRSFRRVSSSKPLAHTDFALGNER